MKKIIMGLVLVCGSLILQGADHALSQGGKNPPPGYDMVRVHPLDSKGSGKETLLGSSPSSSGGVLGVLSAAASYCFSSASPVIETEKEKIAREMRDAVLGKNCQDLKSLLEKHGIEYAEILGPDKYNAFHMVCFNQFMEGIDVLTSGKTGKKNERRKVNIDLLNGKGKTSLQVALMNGHVEVATKLVALGSPVGDEEVLMVRNLRREKGQNDPTVESLAELLSDAKKKTILNDIYDTDTESVSDAEEEELAS
jgi:hypothetical protein